MRIRVYTSLMYVTGVGEEWVMDEYGQTLLVLVNGEVRCHVLRIRPSVAKNTASSETHLPEGA